MNGSPQPRDRDAWTDIAQTFLGLFGMARTTTQEDYTLVADPEDS